MCKGPGYERSKSKTRPQFTSSAMHRGETPRLGWSEANETNVAIQLATVEEVTTTFVGHATELSCISAPCYSGRSHDLRSRDFVALTKNRHVRFGLI